MITTPLPLIQYVQGECVFKYLNAGLNIGLCSGDVCGLVSGVETAAVSPGVVSPRSALSSMTHSASPAAECSQLDCNVAGTSQCLEAMS